MGRRHGEEATVGEDSFLDTTANLVGILIILVVIIGAKTKTEAEAHSRKLAEADSAPELAEPTREAMALQDSVLHQQETLRDYELETEYRRAERGELLAKVITAREWVGRQVEELDGEKRQSLETTQKLESLQSELEDLQQLTGSKEDSPRPQIVLEHLPTPMARTVFQRELHLQLRSGQVTVIPWDRLIEMLKQQIPLTAQRQASRNVLEETLGPVGGFLMKYRMQSVPGGFELERFELEPSPQALSEPLATALSPSGRLEVELASRSPSETVVTVWVYPDSFEDFRTLKARLFADGFLCAARPLPEGVRIGASPQGSRSSAQ